jgi:hypothetical protein
VAGGSPPSIDLKEQLEFERGALAEAKGSKAIDAPTGLPKRFSDERAIHDMWKQRLASLQLVRQFWEPNEGCVSIAALNPAAIPITSRRGSTGQRQNGTYLVSD